MAAQPKAAPAKTPATKAPAAPKAKAPKVKAPAAPAKKPTGKGTKKSRGAPASSGLDPHTVLLHPVVTEKTMMLMDSNNSLEFLVRRTSNRTEVKAAIEKLFDCQVEHVNTRITKAGKRAIVKFAGETSAEDIGMRIGVF